ncbi:hypothetical protein ['Camptotheca acuminata' phytoplasma]|uniref:hypothetical protein n=1 Tax='Camptotheca acuminata' phytoplasma TaxID=3239192 RepID=UPI00351A3368
MSFQYSKDAYDNVNKWNKQFAFFLGIALVFVLVLIKFNIIALNKEKMNSFRDSQIELNLPIEDATHINKVFSAYKKAKPDLTILESDILKVELTSDNSKVRIVHKNNIDNFSLPIEVKLRK